MTRIRFIVDLKQEASIFFRTSSVERGKDSVETIIGSCLSHLLITL